MKKEEERILLSVIDVEEKYKINPAETVSNGGIVSWGADNNPVLFLNCYEKSATLKAAIDQSINYVLGDEIVVTDEAAIWKDEVNRRHQDMDTLFNHIANDYYIFGNFAIQVIFNKLGNPVELIPLDVAKCRLSEDRTKVFYSKKNWTKYQTKSEEYDRFGYAPFNPERPTQIYFQNGPGVRRTYNTAPWAASLDDVLTEIEGSRYSLNSVTNGFSARYLLTLPGTASLTDEQKQAIETSLRERFCGYDAPSNFMLYYAEDDNVTIKVDKIEANEDPINFINMRKSSRSNILTSLRMSPLLLGISDGTSSVGFATQEFSDSYRLYDRTVAAPVRKMLVDSVNDVIGVKDGVYIKPFTINFSNEG